MKSTVSIYDFREAFRCIRPGNQKKNRGMLDDPKYTLGLTPWQSVVKCRGKVKEYNGRRIDTCSDYESNTSMLNCVPDENRGSD